jgi:hypothetical protein
MAAITHELIATNGEYTTKDGQVKTKFHKCGVAMLNKAGETSILIESLPTNFNGWMTLKVPKPKEAGAGGEPTNAGAGEPDAFEDDAPF